MNKLKQLETCGQSPWLDYLKRSLIEKGELDCRRSGATISRQSRNRPMSKASRACVHAIPTFSWSASLT